jgi:hypothetical protein
MKLLLTFLAALALSVSARAELTGKQFGQVRDWAEKYGFVYEGIRMVGAVNFPDANFYKGFACYVFFQVTKNATCYAYVPLSSDTADEGINALIGSLAASRQGLLDQRAAWAEGFQAGVQMAQPGSTPAPRTDL